ncbi:MAG TPA: hypothetical protein PLZ45_16750 [Ferruginibacter sp.]|nr:hypothetical protein [Ferruginibacter sp.]
MLRKITIAALAALILSCNSHEVKEPTTDVEVATAFIRNILDSKFDEAEKFLLKNDTNVALFARFKKDYAGKKKDVLDKYKAADILVNETSYVTDSIYIFNYSNSYTKEARNLKLVRINGKWLVDFAYTFSGNL